MEKRYHFKKANTGILDASGSEMIQSITLLESELAEAHIALLKKELVGVFNQMPTIVQEWFVQLDYQELINNQIDEIQKETSSN